MSDESIETLSRLSKESGQPYLVVLFTGLFAVGFLVLLPLDSLINGSIGPEPPRVTLRPDFSNASEYRMRKAAYDSWASRKMFRDVMWVAGPISLICLALISAFQKRAGGGKGDGGNDEPGESPKIG